MFPFIEIFGRSIGTYSLMTLCGIFTSGIYACLLVTKQKKDYTDIIIFILIVSAGAFAGSHLLYVLVNYKDTAYVLKNINSINTFEKFLDALKITLGGSLFFGGLLGGIFTGYFLVKKNNNYKEYIDIIAVNIPLFHSFGRIGCFLGGCCFGIPCKIGFIYTNNPIPEANGIIRFPVQLFESFFNLTLFFLLNYLYKNRKYKNKLMYVYLIIYAAGRFFIEFLRGDKYRGIWLFISTSQIISILIIVSVIVTQYIIYKNKDNSIHTD